MQLTGAKTQDFVLPSLHVLYPTHFGARVQSQLRVAGARLYASPSES